MIRHPYVAIEGVIGVGKTTLVRLLQPEFGGEAVLEVFDENPFLSDFYADRQRYAFQTQIFFLLSRYRQLASGLPAVLRRSSVISDYTFAKDSLFAHLNLRGDELSMYERVYAALGEKIRRPDLLVYLRADLEVLMGRIAQRDRPYERDMDREYIESLRQAYDQFYQAYDESPKLMIDTNALNIVQSAEDRAQVIEQIKSAVQYGTYQTALPGMEEQAKEAEEILEDLENGGTHTLTAFQQFHMSLDAQKGFDPNPFLNFIALSEEMGELARVLKLIWIMQTDLAASGKDHARAQREAISQHRVQIEDELADCLAYLLKLSNYAGIDLEEAYLNKMSINARRNWHNGQVIKEATQ
jgi:deoxyadenosine/deoxycytidine kinase